MLGSSGKQSPARNANKKRADQLSDSPLGRVSKPYYLFVTLCVTPKIAMRMTKMTYLCSLEAYKTELEYRKCKFRICDANLG